MLRQVKISLAAFAGMLAAGVLILLRELVNPGADYGIEPLTGEPWTPVSWALSVAMFDLPIAGLILIVSLALLEALQPRIKAPRLTFFVVGACALSVVLGGMFAFAASGFFGFDPSLFGRTFGYATPQTLVAGLFLAPALVASLVYVWLTRDQKPGSADPAPQEPYAVEVQGRASPSLQVAPDTRRMMAILTSPTERIGQRAFLYAIRLWSMAASIWLLAPILLAGFLGMDANGDDKYVVAFFGWIVLFWSAFCITANRLHDLSLSAAWAAGPVFAAFAWVLVETPAAESLLSAKAATHAVIALVFCYAITAALLIIRKGDPFANRYGDASI